MTNTSIWERLSFTSEDVERSMAEAKKRAVEKDGRVCVCGHGARCHTSEADPNSPVHRDLKAVGVNKCFPGRQECPCEKFQHVITTSDVRKFMFKTSGSGPDHALAKGIRNAVQAEGVTVDWAPGVQCMGPCVKVAGAVLTPLALNWTTFEEMSKPYPHNVLLCEECRDLARRKHAELQNKKVGVPSG